MQHGEQQAELIYIYIYIFPQAEGVEPTADWFTSMLPSETTKFGTEDSEEDNSLDERDLTTATANRDEFLQKEINNEILNEYGRGSRMIDTEPSTDVSSENVWERMEVLAGKALFLLSFTVSLLNTKQIFFFFFLKTAVVKLNLSLYPLQQ